MRRPQEIRIPNFSERCKSPALRSERSRKTVRDYQQLTARSNASVGKQSNKAHSHLSLNRSTKAKKERKSDRIPRAIVVPPPKKPVKQRWRTKQDKNVLFQMDRHFDFNQISNSQLYQLTNWKGKDLKGNKKVLYIKEVQKRNDMILKVVEQSRLEKLANYDDQWPCLDCRKLILKVRIYMNQAALSLINHKAFENATITVILLNSMTLVFENPADEPPPFMVVIENVFLGLYTFEMTMKIIGMGLFMNRGAYLRDFWGLLDFTIVMSAYFTMGTEAWMVDDELHAAEDVKDDGGLDLKALRAFRVLRPLRTITSIKGLRMLVVSLLQALPMMKQTVIVLLFFFVIFAIGGCQMLSGQLKRRCIDIQKGELLDGDGDDFLCGGVQSCPEGSFCGKQIANPNYGVTNLDNIFYGLLMVFQCTTMEGWSDIQTFYQKAYSFNIWLMFVTIVFIGAFFLMNLTLAVINASFAKAQKEFSQKQTPSQDQIDAADDQEEDLEDIEKKMMVEEPGASGRDIGILKYFLAKRAAKQMIVYLRRRQAEKKAIVEAELRAKRKQREGLKYQWDQEDELEQGKREVTEVIEAQPQKRRSASFRITENVEPQKVHIQIQNQQQLARTQFHKQENKKRQKNNQFNENQNNEDEKQVTDNELVQQKFDEGVKNDCYLHDHRDAVLNFLHDNEPDDSASQIYTPGHQTAPRPQLGLMPMAGPLDDSRQYAWMGEERPGIRPISPMQAVRVNRMIANQFLSTARGEINSGEKFAEIETDKSPDISVLPYDLYFEKLIPQIGTIYDKDKPTQQMQPRNEYVRSIGKKSKNIFMTNQPSFPSIDSTNLRLRPSTAVRTKFDKPSYRREPQPRFKNSSDDPDSIIKSSEDDYSSEVVEENDEGNSNDGPVSKSIISMDPTLENEIASFRQVLVKEERQAEKERVAPPKVTKERYDQVVNAHLRLSKLKRVNSQNELTADFPLIQSAPLDVTLFNQQPRPQTGKQASKGRPLNQVAVMEDQPINKTDVTGTPFGSISSTKKASRPGSARKEKVEKKKVAAKEKKSNQSGAAKKFSAMSNIDPDFRQKPGPPDLYGFLNRKTQKIAINPAIGYHSTSQEEVFQPRIFEMKKQRLASFNQFIQQPEDANQNDSDEPDEEEVTVKQYIRASKELTSTQDSSGRNQDGFTFYHPPWYRDPFPGYCLKTWYRLRPSEEIENDSSEDEDDLQAQKQPCDTITNIGYKNHLAQLSTKFVARRSDVLVTSTLSMTLTPQERGKKKKNFVQLTEKELTDWIDLKHEYQSRPIRNVRFPARGYVPRYYLVGAIDIYKSQKQIVFQNSMTPAFASINTRDGACSPGLANMSAAGSNKSLSMKAKNIYTGNQILGGHNKHLPDCLLRDPLSPEEQQILNEDENAIYKKQKIRHESLLREKKGYYEEKMTMEDANKYRMGTFYDEFEDKEDSDDEQNKEKDVTAMGHRINLDQFEKAAMKILESQEETKKTESNKANVSEIPQELHNELDLPNNLGALEIDFNSVREKDKNMKKKTPIWSGQDVLADSLDEDLSKLATTQLNRVRVLPNGVQQSFWRARLYIKDIVVTDIFEHLMLLAVTANTVTMALDKYGMSPAEVKFEANTNSFFTYLFIVEMTMKLIGLGVRRYVREPMNNLDGTIVLFSMVEIALTLGGNGGEQVRVLRTLRTLRTTRVLRIARVLRSLKSMQVIIAVVRRSFFQFIYIAMLLFVCCFIFALLGKTLFGAKFNYDPKPRGNFDSYNIAFITVFQVLTMENWQTVLFDSMRSSLGAWVPAAYFISWIFIGNFILLNLFLAILLDSFLVEDEAFELTDEQKEALDIVKAKRREARQKARMIAMKKLSQSMFKSGNFDDFVKQQMAKPAMNKFANYCRPSMQQDIIVDDIDDLDTEAIRTMFLDQGILKDKQGLRKQALMFKDNNCELSFYVFTKLNPFRRFLYSVAYSKIFDNGVMFLIGLNSIKLASDTFFLDEPETSTMSKINGYIDFFFTIAFAVEALIKCLALGLILDQGCYLRDSWNQLDFFIVITSLLDLIFAELLGDIQFFKILRLLRALRPLRVISHNMAMKMIVAALMESVGSIFNVMIVVVMVWLMFAILAVNFFNGKSFHCSIAPYRHHDKFSCNVNGGSWLRHDSNYDDVQQAMMTLFIVSTLEGWPDIMINSVDSTEKDKGPSYEANTNYMYFYIVFIMLGSFFLLNFFIGVLFLKYSEAQRIENKGYTAEHINWIALQGLVIEAKVAHNKINKPEDNDWRLLFWELVNSKPFEITIMVFIVLNMVQMACSFEGSPDGVNNVLRLSNYVFTAVFLIECVLNFIAYKLSYFQTSWNRFDFLVVMASLFDLGLEFVDGEDMKGLPIGNIAKVLRVLRVSRMLRLAGKSDDLMALVQTITMSIGALINVFGLLLLILFMFAVLAVSFFNAITEGEVLDPDYKNFKNFNSAYLLLFAIATGEDWNKLMYDCVKTAPDCTQGKTCGTSWAPLYFISFIMVITHVMLNLFILVIIQQFEAFYVAEDNPIKIFKINFDLFHDRWVEATASNGTKCQKISQRHISEFLQMLPAPLGFLVTQSEDTENNDADVKRKVIKMGINTVGGQIQFNELLYRCMRRLYGNFKLTRKMQIIELKTQFRIQMISYEKDQSLKSKEDKSNVDNNELLFENFFVKKQNVNPFLTSMYYKISFMSWLKQTRKHYMILENPEMVFEDDDEKNRLEVIIEVETIIVISSEEEEESEGVMQESQSFDSRKKRRQSIQGMRRCTTLLEAPVEQNGDRFKKRRKTLNGETALRLAHLSSQQMPQIRPLSKQNTTDSKAPMTNSVLSSSSKENDALKKIQKEFDSLRVQLPAGREINDLNIKFKKMISEAKEIADRKNEQKFRKHFKTMEVEIIGRMKQIIEQKKSMQNKQSKYAFSPNLQKLQESQNYGHSDDKLGPTFNLM